MDLNGLLRYAVELGASDIHLKFGRPPIFRRDGQIAGLDGPLLGDGELAEVLQLVGARSPRQLERFETDGDLDVSYEVEGLPRFRVNAYRQRGTTSFAFRVIPRKPPTIEQLGMPDVVRTLAHEHRGLILVTGATGSGKTTTLGAMIDYMNHHRAQHIITIEDPIEILHEDVNCIVNQREIGLDTSDFGEALRRALRQDPDVILIGELRDAETAQTALQAAESGHLVLSSMHTIDAAETCGRMIEFFPPDKQEVVRAIMAGTLRGVISQRLLPRENGGRVAAVEVMVMNARIADLIREGRPEEITDAVAEGEYFGMQTFTQALIDLVLSREVGREVAANAATHRHDFLVALERAEKHTRAAAAANEAPPQALDEQPDGGLRIVPAG